MQCYESGQVFILPVTGSADDLQAKWSEQREREPLDILYSVEDILRYYHIEYGDLLSQFGALPFVARVPEGQEREYADKYRADPDIHVAIPNFLINPLQELPSVNIGIVSEIIDSLNCTSLSEEGCGKDVKIVIIDTGVDASLLRYPNKLHSKQYATDDLTSINGLAPYDPVGHGSAIAYIINSIAPAATIFSIKMMEKGGNIGGLISAIYLAEAEFKPDIYNLSLALTCDVDFCGSCGSPLGSEATINSAQLQFLFKLIDKRFGNKPLLVAAAGNDSKNVKMPAIFPNVLAVGSYDISTLDVTPYSNFKIVPADHFILAPGGLRDQAHCIAYKPKNVLDRSGTFFGTSFSAAFVTAVAARYLCVTKNSLCNQHFQPLPINSVGREFMMECLSRGALQNINNFAPSKHGLGIARYDMEIAHQVSLSQYPPPTPVPPPQAPIPPTAT